MRASEASKISDILPSKLEYYLSRIEKAAKDNFKGVVLGDYIHHQDKKALENLGYRVDTYYDGIEYEESTIYWN